MARARNIKPGFYKNEDLAECSVWARYIFPGLWMLADREGRLEDRPKRIKAELLPFDGQDAEPLLAELAARGFIIRYRNSEGSFIQISGFSAHQSPHYSEKPSVIKPPELPEYSGKDVVMNGGSQPPDSLIPDSPNPDPGFKPPAPSASPSTPAGANGHDLLDPAVEHIPLNDGSEYPVPQSFVAELDRLYPAVDPVQTLREMRGWCIGNPNRRKTKRGVRAFITSWFAREQDKQSRRPA